MKTIKKEIVEKVIKEITEEMRPSGAMIILTYLNERVAKALVEMIIMAYEKTK